MSRLQVGDQVVLNSGGPLMEIEKIRKQGEIIHCFWVVKGEKRSEVFKPQMLTRKN